MPRFVAALPLVALSLLSCAGTVAGVGAPPTFDPSGQTKCSVTKSQTKPLIVEWPSSDRAALESLTKRGVVSVRYEGCEMEVLSQCHAPGGYRYSATTRKSDRVTIKDADGLYANVPLGAARLEATLAKAGELNVAMTIVGRYEADRAIETAESLDGPDCARATHVITAVTVGAFDFFAGADATVVGGAAVANVGGRGKIGATRELITTDGDGEACKKATRGDAQPPEGCGAFLRVEVASIKARPPVCPPGTHLAGQTCATDVSTACPAGMRYVEGTGCVPDLVTAATPETLRAASLVWQAKPDRRHRTWADAKTYCSQLSLSGHSWRLPTKEELKALYESNAPGIRDMGFYWSSTPADSTTAWFVMFNDGGVGALGLGSEFSVRCVR